MCLYIKHEGMRSLFWIFSPHRPHCTVVENSFGFVHQFYNEKLVGADGPDGQLLHFRKQDTFHLYEENNSYHLTRM